MGTISPFAARTLRFTFGIEFDQSKHLKSMFCFLFRTIFMSFEPLRRVNITPTKASCTGDGNAIRLLLSGRNRQSRCSNHAASSSYSHRCHIRSRCTWPMLEKSICRDENMFPSWRMVHGAFQNIERCRLAFTIAEYCPRSLFDAGIRRIGVTIVSSRSLRTGRSYWSSIWKLGMSFRLALI